MPADAAAAPVAGYIALRRQVGRDKQGLTGEEDDEADLFLLLCRLVYNGRWHGTLAFFRLYSDWSKLQNKVGGWKV